MKAWASLFRQFTDANAFGTSSVEMWKTRHKISVDIRIFFTVYSAQNTGGSTRLFCSLCFSLRHLLELTASVVELYC